jgi:hypothetical protein
MKKTFVSWSDVQKHTQEILRQLTRDNWRPDYVVGLTRGGLVPANLISQYLDVPMETLKVSLRDDSSQPESIKSKSVEEIAQLLLDDLSEGEEGVRPGFIGEIGVSSDFTPAERRSLDAASMVQSQTGLPMQIHLPGWFRLGHEVLDAVEAKGVDPRAVVLCHMGPSGPDQTYQQELAARGAFIQYDMIGMELFYADQGVQCPSDEENARHIMQLCNSGFAERVLLSQDIFLKSLMRRFGGPGFGHILQYFVPRLRRHGASDELIELLIAQRFHGCGVDKLARGCAHGEVYGKLRDDCLSCARGSSDEHTSPSFKNRARLNLKRVEIEVAM